MYKVFFSIILYFTIPHIPLAVAATESSAHIITPQTVKLTYKAYWGGFVISNIHSLGKINANGYEMEISYEVTGLASFFSNMKNKVSVQGTFSPSGALKPLVYKNTGSWSRYNFDTLTEFNETDSKIFSHEYEFKFKEDVKYIPIKDELRFGPDMLSFYLGLTLNDNALKIGTELKHQNVFGGFYLLDIAYRCTENKQFKSKRSAFSGEVIVCEFKDSVLDGSFERINKKSKKKKKKNRDKFEPVPLTIWYAKPKDLKNMIPVYSEFPIGWGTVRVYLSDIEVISN
ncbi:MAG: DUF3108 domain-containing protein [Emcibacter sp.]|nr:DUF3108 domain-containing protein [Emcibacter sp.]